jgi:hypothetical protein
VHRVHERGEQPGAAGAERVAERDRAALDVDLRQVRAGLPLPGQHHAGEGLVHLEQVDVLDGQSRLAQRLAGGRDDRRQHHHRVVGRDPERMQSRLGGNADLRGPFRTHDQNGCGSVVQGTAIARRGMPADLREPPGHGLVIERGRQPGEHFRGRGGPDRLVPSRYRELGAEVGGGRAPMAFGREIVKLGPAQVPLGGDQLRADALLYQAVGIPGGHSRAERVRPGRHVGPHRHPAHALHAAGDHHVIDPGHYPLGGEVDRLLGGSALPVHRGRGHRVGEAGREHRPPGGVHRLLAHLVHAAADDVI